MRDVAGGETVYGAERQNLLAQRAKADGRVDVTGAAEDFGVAPETIRRDLGALERHGLVRRVYGGAVLVERLDFEPEVQYREGTHAEEKDRIARAALGLVPARGSVILDAGTTTSRIAAVLEQGADLTVVTNSLTVATQLAGHPRLHMLGGRVRGTTLATVDSWVLEALDGLSVDIGFFGTNGLTVAGGFTTPDPAESAVKAAMLRACRRRVVVMDSSKYGDTQLARFATVEDIDVVVSDRGLDEQAVAELADADVEVVLG